MKSSIRDQSGVSGLVIILATAFLIVLPLGLLGFEMLRFTLVQQELRSVCQAAALAGAVGIATDGGLSGTGTSSAAIWAQDNQAMSGAYLCFCENSVTDCQFNSVDSPWPTVNTDAGTGSTTQASYFNNAVPWTNVTTHTAKVNFVLLDESGNQTNWSPGGPPGTGSLTPAASLRVDAYYGYKLPILGGLGIGPFTMSASATGGLPALDLVFCFDDSGSMDDFTNVTLINRYWADYNTLNGILTASGKTMSNFYTANSISAAAQTAFQNADGGCVVYEIPASPPYSGTPASGLLYNILGCASNPNAANGTPVNVQPPMNLNQAIQTPYRFYFDAVQRNSGQSNYPGNYGVTTSASGNIPNGTPVYAAGATSSNPDITNSSVYSSVVAFTDLVVNLNFPATAGTNQPWALAGASQTIGGKTFANAAWALEASRGNLEGQGTLQGAVNPAYQHDGDNNFGYIIKDDASNTLYLLSYQGLYSGGNLGSYWQAYWEQVQTNAEPLNAAITGASEFFQFLDASANCHFGFICFSDGIGGSTYGPTDTWADGNYVTTDGASFSQPNGSNLINGWATDTCITASPGYAAASAPRLSNCIAGPYIGTESGYSGIGTVTAINPTGDPNSTLQGTFYQPLFQLNAGVAYDPTNPATSYDNWSKGPTISGTAYTIGQFLTATGVNGSGTPIASAVQGFPPLSPVGTITPYLTATASTDITDAFGEAVRELTPTSSGGPGYTRKNAHRGIVLFTDGVPDLDYNAPPGNNSGSAAFTQCLSDCKAVGATAKGLNIQVTGIGLALNANMQTNQGQLFGNSTYTDGIAYAGPNAAPGSSNQQVTTIGSLVGAFQSAIQNFVVITK